ATGLDDGQRIAVQGVVQAEDFSPQGLMLTLKGSWNRVRVLLPVLPAAHPPNWVDAGVSVAGVLANLFVGQRRIGAEIFAPSLAAVRVLQPPPAHPFGVPLQSVSALLRYTDWGVFPHRVRVQGVVTAVAAAGFALQDATGGAWLQWAAGAAPAPPLRLGEAVTAIGFPVLSNGAVVMQGVQARRLGLGPPPLPVALPTTTAANGNINGRLVFAVARLRDIVFSPGAGDSKQVTLYLSRGRQRLQAELEGPAAARLAARGLRPDSRLRLTGIAIPMLNSAPTLLTPVAEWRLWLRNSADVVVLETPPWWTAAHRAWLLGGLALLALLVVLWNLLLRRSLRQQAAAILRQTGERSELERQLQHAQRMEALGRLAGGIAHDFNNLLTVVSGRAAMLLEGACDDRQRGGLQAIQGATDRAAALTRQLLAYSRRQKLAPAPLDLNQVLTEFLPMLRALVGDSIALETDLAPQLPRIFADRGPIEQVVMNLAINARDAMPSGGRLRLATALASPPDATPGAAPHGGRRKRFVRLEVNDNGAGMTEEVRQRIFEPFFTTKDPGHGTGLGLALVYGIVEQSGGEIAVRSAPGQGTTFTLHLPLAGAGARALAARA
ncbi:MAG: sensor histidine kinase, partial [Terriglobales bacterium]